MKKTTRKQLRTIRRRRLALALVGAMAMPMMPALAQNIPNSGSVVNGSATIGQSGNEMTVTQTTKGAIIDWGSFNIGAGYGVTFDQQFGNTSVTLNRVVGFGYSTSASFIDGTLTSNGNVFIINPAGITFGSGAQVNVGGIVASTLWMNSGDFINGLATGQYVFSGFNGDTSTFHEVRNDGTITAGAGGVGLVGQGIRNGGAITSNGGNIVAGAGTQVTLDMFGDGLTQVTINVPPTVDSVIAQENAGSMIADGGQILLRTAATTGGTGGAIYASGTLQARSIANVNGRVELTSIGGPVMVGALGFYDDVSSPFTAGLIDVSGGPGQTGGSVLIQGNGVQFVNDDATPTNPTDPFSVGSMINASGDAGGGQVEIQSSDGVTMLGFSRIIADADAGTAGQVSVAAVGSILIQGDISATTKVDGNGGSVGLLSSTGNLFLIGTVSATGANNGGSVLMSAMNGGLAIDGFVSANGGTGNGGQIAGVAETIVLTEDSGASADGGAGAGGTVGFRATNALAAYGLLSAHGNTAGGSIITASDGTFDFRGLLVDAGATNGTAGSWLLSAPSLTVVNGTDVGSVAAPELGDSVQDAEINYALLTGTSVVLQSGDDAFFDDAQIVANNASPLTFAVNAEGEIAGNAFSITSLGGTLDMVFNSNASGLNTGFSGITFSNATLDSNGGDIAMYGQSDPLNGTASGYDSGIELTDSTISTGGGSLSLRGSTTGDDPGEDAAGVLLDDTDIDTGGGAIDIYGLGVGDTSGVVALSSLLDSGGGNVMIEGEGGTNDGVFFDLSEILGGGGNITITGNGDASGVDFYGDLDSEGGDVSITGTGGEYGVYAFMGGGLQSGGGNIVVRGEGGTEAGTSFTGEINSDGGDIEIYGVSTDAEGLTFRGGFLNGIVSAGGSIDLTGYGVTAGALLVGSGYGNNNIDSGGGLITIIGTASAADAVGVELSDLEVIAWAGDVVIDGSAAAGIGILFEYGASVSTTTGAIGLYGTGADFGLDIADGALDTDSGDITLDGTATAADAVAGVRVTGAGLVTNGGDITVTGTSAGGVGVQLGDGTAFAIGSGGGAITIEGTGIDAGVLMDGNQVASGGGAVSITGAGADVGVSLDGSDVDSAGGDIEIDGTATAVDGAGVSLYDVQLIGGAGDVIVRGAAAGGIGIEFGYGSAISTTTGAIGLYGTGADFGLDITDGTLDTDSGDITLEGTATATTATAGVRVTGDGLITNGGDIRITGTSAGGVGVQIGDGDAFADISSGGGAISIEGTGIDAGVLVQGSSVESDGGAIDILGTGAAIGVLLDGSFDSDGGVMTVTGTASDPGGIGVSLDDAALVGGAGDVTVRGTATAGVGVLLANGAGISTTTGAIGLYGTGADFGLDITDGALDTDSGDVILEGTATSAAAIAGVRVTGDGLTTNGGDITVTGTSAGGVGVQLGDGSAFAIGSGGGAITIEGTGIDAGVLMQGNQVASAGGAISILGNGADVGVSLDGSNVDSAGGGIDIDGTASAAGGAGVSLYAAQLIGGAGDVSVTGSAVAGIGIAMANGSSISTTTGAIGLYGTGADFGLDITDGALDTDSGDITLEGTATAATAIAGVRVTGDGLVTNGGNISVTGTSAGGVGVQLGDGGAFAIGSGGGAISVIGAGANTGVLMTENDVASDGGSITIEGEGGLLGVSLAGTDLDSAGGTIDITGMASGLAGMGVGLVNAQISAGAGDVSILGNAAGGTGLRFFGTSAVATSTGGISLTGIGADYGLLLGGGEFTTDSGHIDLRGRGISGFSIGLEIGENVSIATNGGGVELSGEGGSGGVRLGGGSVVDAGDSLVVIRAGNAGNGDAIGLGGIIRSGVGVNLRPGGVDLNGGLTERTGDEILIGGTAGFALTDDELGRIETPELIIGSNLHAGAIQVIGGVSRDGNLTLQNTGGTGGIDLQAALDVGDGTLALSTGGSIIQTSAGVITAHSLLAQAGGDVLLATALNDVADTTLAGLAGGDFEFQDANTLAIGSVSAIGFDASSGQLSSFGATGITAGGDAFVRNLQGDLTLNAGVTATNIDLVTAGRLQNVAGASLVASGDWRVWANTWEGETRGGLAGDGNLPNLYGCAYLGTCGVTVTSGDNHFIYVQQPIATITFDNATREYGLPNPLFTFSVTGAILGDTAANVAVGSASTTATIGSDVGLYPILGNFTSAAGYQIQFVPGTLAITPATLLFTADGAVRYLGFPNPDFTGTVSGFRNGDTVASVFGDTVIWSSPAGPLSPIGFYPVIGGTSARNYVFAQAPGNATALQVILLPSVPGRPVNFIRETINTYVYDRNFGGAPVCAVNASIDDTGLATTGDGLSTEWTRVRSRPNLTNCFDSERENGCGSF
ncbi:MBG domain-containing protein [Thermomonas carbonis]|uniref:Filamentous hemagglutinin N-terminal domain-containing protein n=1 Tax=Thermomonas carbonis TaxID=1463158 RepID=A0A7G9SPW4_9GAMM|nr:MBG domain-containing protein [Thermomonas carbonis]QNN69889.1 filamentous hemagglutinin N-terminal domain-containing protein [Thermomonas carbonis]